MCEIITYTGARIKEFVLTINPSTSVYDSGDCLGAKQTLEGLNDLETSISILRRVILIEDNQTGATQKTDIDIFITGDDYVAANDNAAFTCKPIDKSNIAVFREIANTSNYKDFADTNSYNYSYCDSGDIGVLFKGNGDDYNAYAQLIIRDAVTFELSSSITVKLYFEVL